MSFADLPERLAAIRERIDAAAARGGGQAVKIVAVTKTHGPEAVTAALAAGLADVGENRIQEALPKMDAVAAMDAAHAASVRWHLIGHLQRNKAKSVRRFDLVHSVDSARLADALDDVGVADSADTPRRAVDALVQVNVAGEDTKGGFERPEWEAEAERMRALAGLRVHGIMTMAPFDADEATLRRVFAGARQACDIFRAAGHDASELSMGMSGDYEIAVEEGATLVRLGTILFGARPA